MGSKKLLALCSFYDGCKEAVWELVGGIDLQGDQREGVTDALVPGKITTAFLGFKTRPFAANTHLN